MILIPLWFIRLLNVFPTQKSRVCEEDVVSCFNYFLNSQDETETIDYSDCSSHVTRTSFPVMYLTTIKNIIRKLINTPITVHYVGNINLLWHVGEVGQKCLHLQHDTYGSYRVHHIIPLGHKLQSYKTNGSRSTGLSIRIENKPSFCSGSCVEIHARTKLLNKTSLKSSWNAVETLGCNFNLVYCRETEAKKGKFFGGTPLLAPRKKFETLKKKMRGVNRLIKEVESEYSVLEDS